jgi:hypothetical protein
VYGYATDAQFVSHFLTGHFPQVAQAENLSVKRWQMFFNVEHQLRHTQLLTVGYRQFCSLF